MTPPPVFFHALLRPAILQILRATGFHAARASVIDSLTDIAAAYMLLLSRSTAQYAAAHRHMQAVFDDDGTVWVLDVGGVGGSGSVHGAGAPSVADVRMALQDMGALLPERVLEEQALVWPPPPPPPPPKLPESTPEAQEWSGRARSEDGGSTAGNGGWYGNGGRKRSMSAPAAAAEGDGDLEMRDWDAEEADAAMDPGAGNREKRRTRIAIADDSTDDEDWLPNEDTRGMEDFIAWFSGSRMMELRALTAIEGEPDADYLTALKKKHSKTGEDSKYHGTILGREFEDAGEVLVEGGDVTSVHAWQDRRHRTADVVIPPQEGGDDDKEEGNDAKSPLSSGLSSLGGRIEEDMDIS